MSVSAGAQSFLDEKTVDPNPIRQFEQWLAEARAARVPEPHAMALATATTAGKPSVRMVYLKGVDERGFLFYTQHESRKGRELAENPWASLAFRWIEIERQIRIDGSVSRASREETCAYYEELSPDSQINIWASRQSEPVVDRAALEKRFAEVSSNSTSPLPCPPHWGGYRVRPTRIEFWRGRENPLHDRICYTLEANDQWKIVRLSP